MDTKHYRYTLNVVADDKSIEKKDKTVGEPIQFYVRGARAPYEIVVFDLSKDTAKGYLSTPKSANAAPPAGGSAAFGQLVLPFAADNQIRRDHRGTIARAAAADVEAVPSRALLPKPLLPGHIRDRNSTAFTLILTFGKLLSRRAAILRAAFATIYLLHRDSVAQRSRRISLPIRRSSRCA